LNYAVRDGLAALSLLGHAIAPFATASLRSACSGALEAHPASGHIARWS
jgi:hypothetical protein